MGSKLRRHDSAFSILYRAFCKTGAIQHQDCVCHPDDAIRLGDVGIVIVALPHFFIFQHQFPSMLHHPQRATADRLQFCFALAFFDHFLQFSGIELAGTR